MENMNGWPGLTVGVALATKGFFIIFSGGDADVATRSVDGEC